MIKHLYIKPKDKKYNASLDVPIKIGGMTGIVHKFKLLGLIKGPAMTIEQAEKIALSKLQDDEKENLFIIKGRKKVNEKYKTCKILRIVEASKTQGDFDLLF